MRRFLVALALGAAAVSVLAATAGATPPSVQVVIRHQLRGCHAWSANGDAYSATQRLRVAPGTLFSFADDDVMPHRLVQLSGPRVVLHGASMHMMDARTSLQLFARGRYVFGTKPGEDYMQGMKTVGPDNVLRLIVVVR